MGREQGSEPRTEKETYAGDGLDNNNNNRKN